VSEEMGKAMEKQEKKRKRGWADMGIDNVEKEMRGVGRGMAWIILLRACIVHVPMF
jgi:hypothetical protein